MPMVKPVEAEITNLSLWYQVVCNEIFIFTICLEFSGI
jgi:hypothetical protein